MISRVLRRLADALHVLATGRTIAEDKARQRYDDLYCRYQAENAHWQAVNHTLGQYKVDLRYRVLELEKKVQDFEQREATGAGKMENANAPIADSAGSARGLPVQELNRVRSFESVIAALRAYNAGCRGAVTAKTIGDLLEAIDDLIVVIISEKNEKQASKDGIRQGSSAETSGGVEVNHKNCARCNAGMPSFRVNILCEECYAEECSGEGEVPYDDCTTVECPECGGTGDE